MKKALQYWFSFLLILLVASILTVGCKAKKIPINNATKETTDKTDYTSVKELTEINKEITDQLIWQLSQVKTSNPECDSITRAYLFQLLNSWNTEKTSGGNSYSLKFNELLERMELQVNLAETQNKSKDSIHEKIIIKEYHTRFEIPVEVPLRWWEKTLMITGVVLAMWQIIKIVNYFKLIK